MTKGRLGEALACDLHTTVGGGCRPRPSRALAVGALVDEIFRQLVTVGTIADPVSAALDALRVDGRHDGLLAWIGELPGSEWSALVEEVEEQADRLRRRWPPLDPAWMPRTQEPMRVRVGGGAVDLELAARVDLAVGVPGQDVASVALVEVKSGIPLPEHLADLRFAALVETLRSPAPPFVVALLYARTGELVTEWIEPAALAEAADRVVAGARRMLDVRQRSAGDLPSSTSAWCARCRWAGSGERAGERGEQAAAWGEQAAASTVQRTQGWAGDHL